MIQLDSYDQGRLERAREIVRSLGSVLVAYSGGVDSTFLLRLAEVRARQHVRHAPSGARVTLSSTVSDTNQTAKNLLEHEGYSLVKYFWRIVIETDEDPDTLQSVDVSEWQNKVRVVVDVDHPSVTGVTRIYEPSGLYIVRQYAVYEKELRAGEQLLQGEVLRLVASSTKDAAA